MRLIDVDGLEEEIRCAMCENPMCTDRNCDGGCEYDERLYDTIIKVLNGRIKGLPSAQPRRGKWVLDNPRSDDSLIYRYACSECNAHHRARYDFCPSCGADMRSESRKYLEYGKLIAKGIEQGLRGDSE